MNLVFCRVSLVLGWFTLDDGEIIVQALGADTESGLAHALRLRPQGAGIVTEIEFSLNNDPRFDLTDPESAKINWASFDELAAGFVLTLVRFRVRVTESSMPAFMPFVYERMTRMRSADKLELSYIGDDDGVRVEWSSDTSEGSSEGEISLLRRLQSHLSYLHINIEANLSTTTPLLFIRLIGSSAFNEKYKRKTVFDTYKFCTTGHNLTEPFPHLRATCILLVCEPKIRSN